MRLIVLALVIASAPAHAGEHFSLYGLGATLRNGDPGWSLRAEKRLDATRSRVTNETSVVGGRIGLEFWNVGETTGFNMPVGFYTGAQLKTVRTTVGGGIGLWAFDWGRGSEEHAGIAPFLSSSIELTAGDMVLSLDGRFSRQVLLKTEDYNTFGVMLMVGYRMDR
jgi:hypothetical protein